jgi:phage gp37-like protein
MRYGDRRRALTVTRESLRRQRDMNDQWGTVWGTLQVAWVVATQLRVDTGRSVESDRQTAENTARLLGGANRLRQHAGARLAGLGPFNTTTTEAADSARRVLGEKAYQQAFQEGMCPEADRTAAYQQILSLALGQPRRHSGPLPRKARRKRHAPNG